MKRALEVVVFDPSKAKLNATVRAAVPEHAGSSVIIPPRNKLFTKAGDFYYPVSPYFTGFKDYIPLIGDHNVNSLSKNN